MMCMTGKLKPCPFCGGEAHLDKAYSYLSDTVIYCEGCDSVFTLDDCHKTAEEIVKAWNNRATHTEVHQYGGNCTHISNCGTLSLNL